MCSLLCLLGIEYQMLIARNRHVLRFVAQETKVDPKEARKELKHKSGCEYFFFSLVFFALINVRSRKK